MNNQERYDLELKAQWVERVDKTARGYELKWGVGRLTYLVDADLATRFNQQLVQFNEIVWSETSDVQAFISVCEAMMRGWAALNADANAKGHKPLSPLVWEGVTSDGHVIAFVRTREEANVAVAALKGRLASVWTIGEIVSMLESRWAEVSKVKEIFPGATVTKVRARKREELNDDIPF